MIGLNVRSKIRILSLSVMISMMIPKITLAASNADSQVSLPQIKKDHLLETKTNVKVENESVTVKNLKNRNVDAVNSHLEDKGKAKLPKNTSSIKFKADGTSVVTTAVGSKKMLPQGFWGDAWQVTKCAAFITMAVVPVFKAYKAVKALGGVRTTARLLVGAGNSEDFMAIAGGAAAEILGISGIRRNCFY